MIVTIKKSSVNSLFVLEDSAERIKWFKQVFADIPIVVYCDKAHQAIETLSKEKFDLILLDHDLEDTSIFQDERTLPVGNNGYTVACNLRHTPNIETEIIVHSMNSEGAANILRAHPFNITHIPFNLLQKYLEVR